MLNLTPLINLRGGYFSDVRKVSPLARYGFTRGDTFCIVGVKFIVVMCSAILDRSRPICAGRNVRKIKAKINGLGIEDHIQV